MYICHAHLDTPGGSLDPKMDLKYGSRIITDGSLFFALPAGDPPVSLKGSVVTSSTHRLCALPAGDPPVSLKGSVVTSSTHRLCALPAGDPPVSRHPPSGSVPLPKWEPDGHSEVDHCCAGRDYIYQD